VIDPSLSVPASFLSPHPESQGPRPNLRLYTRNGSVKADIQIVLGINPGTHVKVPERVLIHAESKNGSVTVRLVCLVSLIRLQV
jgi:hypothetical protein